MRTIWLTFDDWNGGNSWPYHASTEVQEDGHPKTLSASGPTEEYAVENLHRVFNEWIDGPKDDGSYPKEITVPW